MTLETLYYITQIIAVVAVVASLIFVGLQVRQGAEQTRLNTRAVKAAASFEAMHSWASFNEMALGWSDEKLATAIATHDPDKTWDDFTPEVQAMMMVFYRALFQKLEGQFYMYEYGSLDKELWEMRRDWAAGVIQLPFHKVLWEQEKGEKIWTDKFVAVIEAARDTSTVKPLQTYAEKYRAAGPDESTTP